MQRTTQFFGGAPHAHPVTLIETIQHIIDVGLIGRIWYDGLFLVVVGIRGQSSGVFVVEVGAGKPVTIWIGNGRSRA